MGGAGTRPALSERKPVGELLIEAGYVDRAHLEAALALHRSGGKKIVACLCDLGLMDESSFEKFLSDQPGLPSIRLENYAIQEEAIGLIPKDFAMKHQVVPIDRMGKLLTVGMVCPLDIATIEEIEKLTNMSVSPMLCSLRDIRECIRRCYSSLS